MIFQYKIFFNRRGGGFTGGGDDFLGNSPPRGGGFSGGEDFLLRSENSSNPERGLHPPLSDPAKPHKVISCYVNPHNPRSQPTMGGSGRVHLPTDRHIGQSGGEVTELPIQVNHPDCSGVAQHALVLGPSDHVQSGSPQSAQPFNQIPHRNLTNLNLHAWLLEPHQSRSRASLKQWQQELRLLNEVQPDQSMRQSGPFLQSGASLIRWTSGLPL